MSVAKSKKKPEASPAASLKAFADQAAKGVGGPTLPELLRNIKPVPRDWYEKKPAPVEYVLPPIWQVGEVAQLVGQAGAGKTFLSLAVLASIGTGAAVLGFPEPKPRKALYVMCERHEGSLRRRWHKVTHAIAGEIQEPTRRASFERLLPENCHLKAIAGATLSLVEFHEQQWQPATMVDELITELKRAGIAVLLLDPLSRLHGGNENAAEVGSAITRALERITVEAG